jgi:cytochrome c oxidase subunit 2
MRAAPRSLAPLLAAALLAASPQASAQEKVIQVSAERFKFTPNVIRLKAGVPAVLELTSLDRRHGFKVPDLKIDEVVEKGQVLRVRVLPQQAGTYEFHCSVFCGGGHEEMAGQIVVEP